MFVSVFGPILCVIIGDRRIDKKATQGVSRLQVLESEAHIDLSNEASIVGHDLCK